MYLIIKKVTGNTLKNGVFGNLLKILTNSQKNDSLRYNFIFF